MFRFVATDEWDGSIELNQFKNYLNFLQKTN